MSRKFERMLELSREHVKQLLEQMRPSSKKSRLQFPELLNEVFLVKAAHSKQKRRQGSDAHSEVSFLEAVAKQWHAWHCDFST